MLRPRILPVVPRESQAQPEAVPTIVSLLDAEPAHLQASLQRVQHLRRGRVPGSNPLLPEGVAQQEQMQHQDSVGTHK